MTERYTARVRAAWRALDEARTWRSRVDDSAADHRVDDARSDLLRVLSGQRPVPPEVREAQRRIDEWCEDNPGPVDDDPALMAQMEELHARYYAAEEAARQRYEQDLAHEWEARRRRTEQRERDLHRDVEALRRLRSGLPPDEEDPVTGDWFDARRAQVWGVIQPDGSVVAKGFVGDETADEDQAVYPAGSLAYYSPEWGWTNAATGHPASRGPARPEVETLMPDQSDVKVHHSKGCGLCGRTDPHTHTLSDWRAHIGGDGHGGGVYDAPPAAEPYTPPKRTADAAWAEAADAWDRFNDECPSTTPRARALFDEAQSADRRAEALSRALDPETYRSIDDAYERKVNAAYEAEAQRQADHRRQHNEFIDAENEKSAAHQREQDEETARRLRLAADLARHDAAVEARKRPDLADLRRGRWYDEKPITSTNAGSGGSGMSSIDEVRAGIMAAVEKMNEGLGAVQHGHACVEDAQGQLMHATEGSGQHDVSEANGLLAQAVNSLDEVRQQVAAAISASEGVANRL